ncbi:MAG: hypothetical protein ACR2IQ_02765 [Minisyncoccia bacterium]
MTKDKEKKILKLLEIGLNNSQIANRLKLSRFQVSWFLKGNQDADIAKAKYITMIKSIIS